MSVIIELIFSSLNLIFLPAVEIEFEHQGESVFCFLFCLLLFFFWEGGAGTLNAT